MKNIKKKTTLFGVAFILSLVSLNMLNGCTPEKEYDYEKLIYVNYKSLTLFVGDAVQLKASPSSIATKWLSEDPNVADVSAEGVVTANKAGETFIIATQQDATEKKIPVKVASR
jgi:hypothetical protein